jgi:polyisoprenoid-binding protein YceI
VRRALKYGFGALVIVVLAVGGFLAWWVLSDHAPGKPKLSATSPTATGGPATPDGPWHIVRNPEVFVGYRIKELFGDAVLKHDVVGRTPAVNGRLTIAHNRVTQATVTADLRQLASDRAARDSYIHDHALDSDTYPTGRFTLTAPITLPGGVTRGQEVHAQASGRLELHGVTRPVTIALDARWNGPTIQVVGTAPIKLADFKIDAPHTVIADVDDHGSFEVDLLFAPGRA